MNGFDIPKGTLCAKSCGREAVSWYGDVISAMDMAHGHFGEPWCEQCIVERQLEYARERADGIPHLEEKLDDIKKKEA